jgi:hypothetical protein
MENFIVCVIKERLDSLYGIAEKEKSYATGENGPILSELFKAVFESGKEVYKGVSFLNG